MSLLCSKEAAEDGRAPTEELPIECVVTLNRILKLKRTLFCRSASVSAAPFKPSPSSPCEPLRVGELKNKTFLAMTVTLAMWTHAAASSPRVFILNAKQLATTKQRINSGDKSLEPALKKTRTRRREGTQRWTIHSHLKRGHTSKWRQARLHESGALLLG